MGRPVRVDVAGHAYHVLNRSVGRRTLFRRRADFAAFEQVLAETVDRFAGRVALLAYCLMPNHWHLVVFTREDGVLSPFMKWLTLTHTQRYRVAHGNVGEGPVYQGRFKSFLIDHETHLLSVCRYVERNAARATLVERAEQWRWSSLWRSRHPDEPAEEDPPLQLSDWPIPGGRPKRWLRTVNTPLNQAELDALQQATQRGRPYGREDWVERMIERFDLASTNRRPGRPQKEQKA